MTQEELLNLKVQAETRAIQAETRKLEIENEEYDRSLQTRTYRLTRVRNFWAKAARGLIAISGAVAVIISGVFVYLQDTREQAATDKREQIRIVTDLMPHLKAEQGSREREIALLYVAALNKDLFLKITDVDEDAQQILESNPKLKQQIEASKRTQRKQDAIVETITESAEKQQKRILELNIVTDESTTWLVQQGHSWPLGLIQFELNGDIKSIRPEGYCKTEAHCEKGAWQEIRKFWKWEIADPYKGSLNVLDKQGKTSASFEKFTCTSDRKLQLKLRSASDHSVDYYITSRNSKRPICD